MTEGKTCSTCGDDTCSAKAKQQDETVEEYLERQKLESRLCGIKNKIIVLSGKGGVGKSTVSVNLAMAMAAAGHKVGLMDIDIHGPSLPKLLALEDQRPKSTGQALLPVTYDDNLKVMSVAFLLPSHDDAVIWRGPLKMGIIKQFIGDVEWGDLDFLFIDSPPGTGDEPLTIAQLIPNITGAVVVTTPQDVAIIDVRKSITFCRKVGFPILGVVENMSGFVCPDCGKVTDIFGAGGGQKMAEDMGVPFLGKVPIEAGVAGAADQGRPLVSAMPDSHTAKAFAAVTAAMEKSLADGPAPVPQPVQTPADGMRIAVPVANGILCAHFGHCEQFAVFNIKQGVVQSKEMLTPPPHEPGVIPKFLGEQKVNLVLAGGMGSRAQDLFGQYGVKVIVGAPGEAPEKVVEEYLSGTLETGENVCDH